MATTAATSPFLSIAIPTMRRWEFLRDSLPLYLSRQEVLEVIVCDETGEDIEAIQASPFYTSLPPSEKSRLRLFKNEKRLGIYENKRKAFAQAQAQASAPFVAILDSDNIFSEEWFEVLHANINLADKNTIYASASFLSLSTDTGESRKPCEAFEGKRITKGLWNSTFTQTGWNHLLNDGNWVVPREAFKSWPSLEKVSKGFLAGATFCDALFSLRAMIVAGFEIWYVPGLSYIHTVHQGSSWLQTSAPSCQAITTTDWRI
jgi:glycosyltransferase involved in cell wall biosynthesis